jgi:hypothetical protein
MKGSFQAYRRTLLLSVILGLMVAVPAESSGFIIIPTYDTSIASDPNSAAIESAINLAIQQYENTFTNSVTVQIYFEETTFPQAVGLSEASLYQVNYHTFYDQLVANNANPAAIAALTANGGNSANNPVNGTTNLDAKAPNLRALGFTAPGACQLTTTGASQFGVNELCGGSTGTAYDGLIGLNVGITYPPQSNNGNNYGLESTAEHEIDEVLGLGSALENCLPGPGASAACNAQGVLNAANDTPGNAPFPEDLFRWNTPSGGARTLSTNCTTPTSAYFSYGPSTGVIAQFNNLCNGADFGDWAGNSPDRVQDAFGTPGTNPTLGPAEIAALTAIGFDAPEPAIWTTMFTALVTAAFARRRFRR